MTSQCIGEKWYSERTGCTPVKDQRVKLFIGAMVQYHTTFIELLMSLLF